MPLAITVLSVVRFRHGPYHMDSSLAPTRETSGVPNFKFSSFNFIITSTFTDYATKTLLILLFTRLFSSGRFCAALNISSRS